MDKFKVHSLEYTLHHFLGKNINIKLYRQAKMWIKSYVAYVAGMVEFKTILKGETDF